MLKALKIIFPNEYYNDVKIGRSFWYIITILNFLKLFDVSCLALYLSFIFIQRKRNDLEQKTDMIVSTKKDLTVKKVKKCLIYFLSN